MLLSDADKLYLGTAVVDSVYAGANKVWPAAAAPTTTWSTDDATAAGFTLSNGNTIWTIPSGAAWRSIRSTTSKSTGLVYFECKCTAGEGIGIYQMIGLADAGFVASSNYLGAVSYSIGYGDGNNVFNSAGFSSNGPTLPSTPPAVGDVEMMAVNFTSSQFWVGLNGTWMGSGDPATGTNPSGAFVPATVGPLFAAMSGYDATNSDSWQLCPNAATQKYALPAGFSAWDATAAWTLLASGSQGAETSASVSIDTTGADLIVAVCTSYGNSPPATLTDSNGNTWATAVDLAPGGSYLIGYILYAHKPVVGANHTFTWDVTGGALLYGTLEVLAFSGSSLTDPVLDQTNSLYSTSSATSQPGAILPSQNNSLIITGSSQSPDNSSALTSLAIDAPYIVVESQPYNPGNYFGGGAAYQFQATAASTNPTWSWTPAYTGQAIAVIASFKGA
jgi:hypothetical protein